MFSLGIDTSNYTTSAAAFDMLGCKAYNFKQLLPVKPGDLGLRQSDAVFHHTQQLPKLLKCAFEKAGAFECIGVSARPRDLPGSYMPCFTVGSGTAEILGNALRVPVYEFSHQAGHIAAAVLSSGNFGLLNGTFIAFHFSGGTTEAVLVTPDKEKVFTTKIIAASTDLKAGQAIDRAGVMLGLDFPAGAEIDRLSLQSNAQYKIHPSFNDVNPSLSGIENKCKKMLDSGEKPCDIAKFVIDSVLCIADKMAERLLNKYGNYPLLFAGGVMSNTIMRKYLFKKYNASFAEPEFSSDNASGVALLASVKNGSVKF